MQPLGEDAPICQVQEGMPVVDISGAELGTVTVVKMGDPVAGTSQGQVSGLDEPRFEMERPAVSGPHAERLLRTGFLKVRHKGLFAASAYVASEDVGKVEDGTVHLCIGADGLLAEV